MRLIDADALIKYLQDNHYASILEMCMKPIINNQPTAYDVEKVVAELEKLKVNADTTETRHHNLMIDICIDNVRKRGVT